MRVGLTRPPAFIAATNGAALKRGDPLDAAQYLSRAAIEALPDLAGAGAAGSHCAVPLFVNAFEARRSAARWASASV